MTMILTDNPTPRQREHAIVLKAGDTTHLDNGWIVQNDSFQPLFVVGAQHFEGVD
jgi:hypothetical protein